MITITAIQAAISILKKSAQDLAVGVSINGVPQWADEPATQAAHDHELAVVNDLKSALDYITGLNAEAVGLRAQLAAEVARLDFVLGKYAYCAKFSGCVNASSKVGDGYQLIVSDEEVDCIAISGEDVNHPTPRAAIDAAIGLAKGGA